MIEFGVISYKRLNFADYYSLYGKNMKIDKTCFNQERFTVYFLLFLIYLITFYPLTKIGFTVGDDIDFYIELGKDNLHEIIRNTAFSHGRFFFLFMRYFLLVPHLIDNPIYFDLCYILPIASSFILFSRLIIVIPLLFFQLFY